jgi:hypothetical protein
MNINGWNQIVNELFFINDIKLIMTFHGFELYFIKWTSSSMEFGWILMDEIKLWIIIFHQWHRTFNDISQIWTLFHRVNFIIHGNWMNHKRWNQIVNELYFINDIKNLVTFHGSKLYFIKWISSFMEIYHSSLKFHPRKLVNGKFM